METPGQYHWFHQLRQLFRAARGVANDSLQLLRLEVSLAKKSLIKIIELCVFVFILVISTWFSLMTTLIFGLHRLGMPWLYALLLITIVNGISTLIAYKFILKYSKNLKFPAIRKQLNFNKKPYD